MQHIEYNSHVLVLDYNLNESELGKRSALKSYEAIKEKHPRVAVTLLSSDEEIGLDTKEMERVTSEYIIDRGRHLYNLLKQMHRVVVRPIVRFVTLPVRRVRHYYMLGNYMMMFVVAFLSVGILSLLGYFGTDLVLQQLYPR